MSTKTINIIYWISTVIFSLLMISTAIPNVMVNEDSIKFIHDMLGYPVYFIAFIGVAKLIGSIAILIPGFDKIKEWSYAGLFFDIASAIYSGIAVAKKVDPQMIFLLLWIVPGIVSYIFWNKKKKLTGKA